MLERKETQKVLRQFGANVVRNARKELKNQKINTTNSLSRSLKSKAKANPNSLEMSIFMQDYGKFIDKGVKGKISSKKAPLSPYKYKDQKPPVNLLQTWVQRKRIVGFRARNRRSVAFAVQNAIYNYGIKETKFFSKPFENAFKSLPEDLVEAYGLDLENFIKFTLKDTK